jgi:hypothetical protein
VRRPEIYAAIDSERERQEKLHGLTFDERNTPNDWVACISQAAGKAVTRPLDKEEFRKRLLHVAAICVAALELDTYPPRHYDR